MSTQLDLSSQTGVGPFDISGLDMIDPTVLSYGSQITVSQNSAEISDTEYTIDSLLQTLTFISPIDGLTTIINRATPVSLVVQFNDGARLPASDLNTGFKQVMNKVDEIRTDPVASLQLNDLSDVGAPGDTPANDYILLFNGTDWLFENRGAINAVTADNVSVAYNSSDAETTLAAHEAGLTQIADQAQDISHSGNVTQLAQDGRILGDLDVVGVVTFGSLGSDIATSGTLIGSSLRADTVNGATGFTLANTGSGADGELTMDFAGSYFATRNQTAHGMEWYSGGSNLMARLQPSGRLTIYDEADKNSYTALTGPDSTGDVAIQAVRNGTSQFYVYGDGSAYSADSTAPTSVQLMNRNQGDARYARLSSSSYGSLKQLYSMFFSDIGDAPTADRWICGQYAASLVPAYATFGGAYGDFVKQNHATVDNSLVSTRNYRFEYFMITRVSNTGYIKRRRGVTSGSNLTSLMSSDSQGYALGATATSDVWIPTNNSTHYISGWYQQEDI